jgi:hypothetical protein
MVVQTILLSEYSLVGNTPSAAAKLLSCFIEGKSTLGVIILENSQSWGNWAGCWDDPLESEVTLTTNTIIC